MEIEQRALIALSTSLAVRWEMDAAEFPPGSGKWQQLVALLEKRILQLMQGNMQRLMTALYIHDLEEHRFIDAMEQPTMEDRAHSLAVALLERETEKIRSREKYGGAPTA